MTHDPWTLHAALSCPSCHVVGKVVRFEREDGGYDCCDDEHLDDVDPYTCCECGQTWADTGQVGDVKEYRVQYMRLVEGRPYEAPKPPEPKKATPHPFDQMLADRWRKDIEERAARPAFDLSKLKKSARAKWPTIDGLIDRAKEVSELLEPIRWVQPSQSRPRSKVLPTGDVVTDLGGSATIQFKDNSDPPWTSWLLDADTGAKTICIGYRTKWYHWNLATDEVTEK